MGGGARQPTRQPAVSLYSLTLNEVQRQLGQSFHGMNLDQLLRNVLHPPEENQTLPILNIINLDNSPPPPPSVVSRGGLDRRSCLDLVRALSNKTIDEVWMDIRKVENDSGVIVDDERTLGETTLEDFLGMAAEGYKKKHHDVNNNSSSSSSSSNQLVGGVHWLQQYRRHHQQQQPHQSGGYVPIVGGAISETGGTMLGMGVAERKIEEKTVERRQKRMIQNRESAARSRARKQAYTNELENKIARLEDENSKLKEQKELDRILQDAPSPEGPEPMSSLLRRTNSSLF